VLFERIFDAVNAGLRAHFVLVTGAAANTDGAYLHVVCCHDRQSTSQPAIPAILRTLCRSIDKSSQAARYNY
jgi:hypothetical protein